MKRQKKELKQKPKKRRSSRSGRQDRHVFKGYDEYQRELGQKWDPFLKLFVGH